MGIDLGYDDVPRQLAASVAEYCARQRSLIANGEGVPGGLWTGLGDLGVLGAACEPPAGQLVAATMEALGAAAFPGPLAATFASTTLVGPAELDEVVSGRGLVAWGVPPLMPWSPVAEIFIEVSDGRAYLGRPAQPPQRIESMAGDPWGRCELERIGDLGPSTVAEGVRDLALAAYLVGAAGALLTVAAGWAADRVQFGRPIGTFQAVAHPLADTAIDVAAARTLTRIAAYEADLDAHAAVRTCATARLSATGAALRAAFRAHQTLGAMGFTVEGPVGRLARMARAN